MALSLNARNAHPRDSRIVFFEKGEENGKEKLHFYRIDGISPTPYVSVTTWIKRFSQEFDDDAVIAQHYDKWQKQPSHRYHGMSKQAIKDKWEEIRVTASSLGTALHNAIERWYDVGEEPPSPIVGWDYFQQYQASLEPDLVPYRVEQRLFDEESKISGSIDILYALPDGTYELRDWKASRKIEMDAYGGKTMLSPVSHLQDTNFWHYAIQLNMYRYILQKHYEKKVTAMKLVILHQDHGKPLVLPVPILDKETQAIFDVRIREISQAPPDLGPLRIRLTQNVAAGVCNLDDGSYSPSAIYEEYARFLRGGFPVFPLPLEKTIETSLMITYENITSVTPIESSSHLHRKYPDLFECSVCATLPYGGILVCGTGDLTPGTAIEIQYALWITRAFFVDYIARKGTDIVYYRVFPSKVLKVWMKKCLFFFSGALAEALDPGETPSLPLTFYQNLTPPPLYTARTLNMLAELYQ